MSYASAGDIRFYVISHSYICNLVDPASRASYSRRLSHVCAKFKRINVRLRTAQYISDYLFDCLSHWITVGNLELIHVVNWRIVRCVKAFIRLNHLLLCSKTNLDNFADRMALCRRRFN